MASNADRFLSRPRSQFVIILVGMAKLKIPHFAFFSHDINFTIIVKRGKGSKLIFTVLMPCHNAKSINL